MSNTKTVMGQASNQYVVPPGADITDVFSTYLFEGNATSRNIVNGVDLTEGGLVWLKNREGADDHLLFDTERGAKYIIRSNTDNANLLLSGDKGVTSFNSDGFTLGAGGVSGINTNGIDDVSWTFRKAPKFFDVVTYSGDGTNGRAISHNLGTTVGTLIIKETNASSNWLVFHRSLANTDALQLNTTAAKFTGQTVWGSTTPTDTQFYVSGSGNNSGKTYVAYLFAHNDGDGEFGPDGDQDIIKCGSFTGGSDVAVDVGFEPQWVLTKATGLSQNWTIHDTMRGYTADATGQATLHPNLSDAEDTGIDAALTSTGFRTINSSTGQDYIYIAIRRGPLYPPESATEVFTPYLIGSQQSPMSQLGSPVDMTIHRYNINNSSQNTGISSRLTAGKYMFTNTTDAETISGLPVGAESAAAYDYQLGVSDSIGLGFGDDYTWMWKRAPGFCDVVAYSGDAVAGRTVSHNLGVAPEMIWVKKRNAARSWIAYHSGIGSGKFLELDNTSAAGTASTVWYDTDPTATDFTVGTNSSVNQVPDTYIAYLFASLDGISKLGSFSHATGTPTNVDCGFTAGARFVLWKKTNNTDGWQVYDTTRGINSGNEPFLQLNSATAEITGEDLIDPLSTGFTVSANKNSGDYIFYAIA